MLKSFLNTVPAAKRPPYQKYLTIGCAVVTAVLLCMFTSNLGTWSIVKVIVGVGCMTTYLMNHLDLVALVLVIGWGIMAVTILFLLSHIRKQRKAIRAICSGIDIILEGDEAADHKRHKIEGVAVEAKVGKYIDKPLWKMRKERFKNLGYYLNKFVKLDSKGRPEEGAFVKMDFTKL